MSRKSRFAGLAAALKPKGDAPAQAKKVAKSQDKANYVQTTVYLARSVHAPLQAALAEDRREYSQLVEDLIADWLKGRKRGDV